MVYVILQVLPAERMNRQIPTKLSGLDRDERVQMLLVIEV